MTAPLVRLEPLRFALASDGRVCVRGEPLPSLPGESWVLHGSIALPAGFGFPEVCTSSWLESLLSLPKDGIALWPPDGAAEVLPPSAFVPATRANVRSSARNLAHSG
jgi:hypothetical protein